MGSKWPLVKLGEYCCKIGSGATPKGGSSVYLDAGDVCLIRSQNIYNDGFEEGGLVYIDEVAAAKLRNVIVEHNDILLNITGDSVARVCLVPDAYLPARVNQHVAIIRPNKEHFDARFLRYFLASPKTQILLLNLSSAGATRNALTKSMIENFEVPKPSLSVQVFIANILQILDDKIMKNRQINKTLEQMAQTLFKSWFVDFDPVVDNALDAGFFEQDLGFSEELLHRVEVRKAVRDSDNFKPLAEDIRQLFPNAFEECAEPALGLGGWVPKRWRYAHFGDLLSSTIGGDWGKDIQDEKHTVQSRIVRGTDIPGLSNGQLSDAPLRWVEPKKLKSRQIEVGDIIIEVSGGSPTQSTGRSLFITQLMLERLGGVVEPASFCRRFKPKSYTLGMLASIHLKKIYSDGKMWEYQNQSTGIANFQTKFFLDAEQVLIPSNEVLDTFTKIVRPFIEKSQNNEQIELTHLRDTLLPKLISGELSLSDIKTDIPEETLI
ncbi:restriction endonuclease subunit S [Proteus mirabilis]|uniref:restriction endonuclease subunit S n=1 Tax=Proteus mirabilis TaxID=584 RepID=UPI001C2C5976|nr:restriction endonuclease subunit S [Proteus mirabilis]MBU9980417.1 restriction endonuclease subunit S [Proteus mirabilis]